MVHRAVGSRSLIGKEFGRYLSRRGLGCFGGGVVLISYRITRNYSGDTLLITPFVLIVEERSSPAHVILECRGMDDIWRENPFRLPRLERSCSTMQIFTTMKKHLHPDQFLVALVLGWKIWDLRNKEVHGSTDGFLSDIVGWARRYLRTYQEAQVPGISRAQQNLAQSWTPPAGDFIKINVDAALPKENDFYRISLVARDSQGECLWWTRTELVGRLHPTDAEALAVLQGVKFAAARAWRRVIVETDCLPVFRYLQDQSCSLASYGGVLDSCLDLCSDFQSFVFFLCTQIG